MISREIKLRRIPLWFIDTPSETEIVEKLIGTPPPAATPRRAASACGASDIEHGVLSPRVSAMAMRGLPRSASSRPVARMKARCGVRSRPATVMRERYCAFPMTPPQCALLPRTLMPFAPPLLPASSAPRQYGSPLDFDLGTRLHESGDLHQRHDREMPA